MLGARSSGSAPLLFSVAASLTSVAVVALLALIVTLDFPGEIEMQV